MQLTEGLCIAIIAGGGSIIGNGIKARYDLWIAQRQNETTIATAALEAKTADDLRVNERIRALLDGYEKRIEDLEGQLAAVVEQVKEMTARLDLAQEERRMAEITIETAHLRVEDLETELVTTRTDLQTARDLLDQARVTEAGLQSQNQTLRARIVALEARVAELEGLLEQYRSLSPERVAS